MSHVIRLMILEFRTLGNVDSVACACKAHSWAELHPTASRWPLPGATPKFGRVFAQIPVDARSVEIFIGNTLGRPRSMATLASVSEQHLFPVKQDVVTSAERMISQDQLLEV